MRKKYAIFAFLIANILMLSACSQSIPIIGDFIKSDNSLGKTNNTAVAIADAMKGYLKEKDREDCALYGMELILNSDRNGTVKLYYTDETPENAEYSDVYVAEVDSKTGHVERFGSVEYAKDDYKPFEFVRQGHSFDAASLPIDSNKAISKGAKAFSDDTDFHYDYVQMELSAMTGIEQYEIRFISMLNDKVYCCTVDAVSGAVLSSSEAPLE